jgi:hypothetical protein
MTEPVDTKPLPVITPLEEAYIVDSPRRLIVAYGALMLIVIAMFLAVAVLAVAAAGVARTAAQNDPGRLGRSTWSEGGR